MNPLLIIASLFAGAIIFLVLKGSSYIIRFRLYQIALGLALVVILAKALLFFGIKEPGLRQLFSFLIKWSHLTWFVLSGFIVAALVSSRKEIQSEGVVFQGKSKEVLYTTLLSAAIMCAGFYFLVSIGKIEHSAEMEEFFIQSGYPVAFNYIIIATECICSIALLVLYKKSIGIIPVIVLLLIMTGAVITHVRNSDPVSDSYDAFHANSHANAFASVVFCDEGFS